MATQTFAKLYNAATGKLLITNTNAVFDTSLGKYLNVILAGLNTSLTQVKNDLNAFLNGAADGGTIDRLTELVAAIDANKDNIDALVADKVAKADIVNSLDSNDAEKVLSAAQGKALKDLIDAVQADQHSHDNKDVLDNISVNQSTGNLIFNNKELTGETGIAYGATLAEATDFTGRLQIVLEEFDDGVTAG